MALNPGTRLGPYEILAPLGAGGMGEVYRARDTRLDRTVAIKILPAQFSSDPIRKQRFEREARTISSLNHPSICTLFDIGHQDGTDYLVMECIEGETLAKRLEKGPLPIDQVLSYGAQIAAGLDGAHRNGVVHRDLKPGNIMLTPAGAKLLDFGLARAAVPLVSAATLTATPKQSPITEQGAIIGTFQYMSPEQVEGKDVDARSDIFSFGAVLYEMVTGKRAFGGNSQLSVASAILEKEPDSITAVKPMTPAALDHVVKKCLAKLPDDRWQSASDLASELKWIAASGPLASSSTQVLAGRTGRDRLRWWLPSLLLLIAMAAGALWWLAARHSQRALYFNSTVPFPANDVALSPDGQTLALVAYSDQANKYVIWTHEVGNRGQTAVPGTEDASHLFWSPDKHFIGFFANGKLKKIDLSSGSVQVLSDAPNGRGGTWNRDGVILFAPDVFTGIYRVSSAGGEPEEVTHLDASRAEQSHRWPVFLPDGHHFLFLAANFGGAVDKNAVYVGSLDSTEKKFIVKTSSNSAYADPGYLLYVRDNALVAQPFDLHRYALGGDPRTLFEEVQYLPQIDLALFDVAGRQTLIAQTGRGAAKSQLTWLDRDGRPAGTVGPPGVFANPHLAPDGQSVAIDQTGEDGRNVDIWIRDLKSDAARRFTFGPSLNQNAVWSPDGKRIVFDSNRKLSWGLYLKNADGSGSQQEIVDLGSAHQSFWDWSRDGKYLLVRKEDELWSVSLPDWQPKPYLQAKWFVRNAQFSPDGRWVAYSSNESGTWEIYVSPFPVPNGKWQVSKGGGEEPRWRGDGKELFYLSADGKMTAVPVQATGSFVTGSPVTLFQTRRWQPISAQDMYSYDVAPDGRRFLINTKIDEPNVAPISIILNWASEMEK